MGHCSTRARAPDQLADLLVQEGEPAALFSGGSLMAGAVGRGDEHSEELARRMHHDRLAVFAGGPPDWARVTGVDLVTER